MIIENAFKQDVIQCCIQVFDIFYTANQLRPKKYKINTEEFYNDALNNDVDLKRQAQIFYKEFNAQKDGEFDKHASFTLFNYGWILNPYRKSELFSLIQQINRE